MMGSLKWVMLAGSVLIWSGCTDESDGQGTDGGEGSGGPGEGGEGSGGPGGVCYATQALEGGVACAIVPSSTRAGISDVPDPGSSHEYHAVAFPEGSGPDTPVFLYFKGSGNSPFAPSGAGFGDGTLRIMQQGVDHGFIVIMPAYPRVRGGTIYYVCLPDPLCYELFRREMLEGVPRNPDDPTSVVPPNDIMSRVEALAAHVAASAPARFPSTLDWSHLRVGGGSQGAGHAAFLAKYLHTVERACMFAGPGDNDIPLDQPDAGIGTPAPWLESAVWETPRDRFRGLIHEEDQFYRKTTSAWQALGLEIDRDWRVLTGPVAPNSGHGYVSGTTAEAATARGWACFD